MTATNRSVAERLIVEFLGTNDNPTSADWKALADKHPEHASAFVDAALVRAVGDAAEASSEPYEFDAGLATRMVSKGLSKMHQTSSNTFILAPWRTIMTKNVAASMKAKEVKAASKSVIKRLAAQGMSNEVDAEQTGDFDPTQSPRSAFGSFAASQLGDRRHDDRRHDQRRGIDNHQPDVVESGFSSTQSTEGTTMTDKTKQELDAEKAQAKIAEKEAKAAAKAEREAAALAKKAAAQAEREAKIKERDEAAAKRKADREAAIAAAGDKPPRERTYDGSMLALADRVKAGQYVKGTNGQLRSDDEVARVLDSVPAKKVVSLLLEVLKMPNIYAAKGLNYGQQSMNLRNRLRGALRQGTEVGEGDTKVKVTLDYVKQVRDDGGYATAEAEAAEKAAKKAKIEEAATAS